MHLTKDQQRQALYRGQGSIAFVGAARLVLAVGADPDDESRERRFLMPVKSNVCAPAATLAYRIVSEDGRGRLTWEPVAVDGVDVDAVLAPKRLEDAEGRHDAQAFLQDALDDGPVPQKDIEKAAKAEHIAVRTLYRAKRVLQVESDLVGFGPKGKWYWRLPGANAPELATAADNHPEAAIYPDVAISESDREKPAVFVEADPEIATSQDMAISAEPSRPSMEPLGATIGSAPGSAAPEDATSHIPAEDRDDAPGDDSWIL
jgi:hypothetical protein